MKADFDATPHGRTNRAQKKGYATGAERSRGHHHVIRGDERSADKIEQTRASSSAPRMSAIDAPDTTDPTRWRAASMCGAISASSEANCRGCTASMIRSLVAMAFALSARTV